MDELLKDLTEWTRSKQHEPPYNEIPDFWDDLNTTERLAEYLFALGYRKVAVRGGGWQIEVKS